MREQEKLERIAKVFKQLQGNRTNRQMARDGNVSATIISDVKNCKWLITKNVIEKLTTPSSNPQNGITEDDLMIAAGYKSLTEEKSCNSKWERRIQGTIMSRLAEKGLDFTVTQDNNPNAFYDFAINVNNQKWCLDVHITSHLGVSNHSLLRLIYNCIGRMVFLKPDKAVKMSIVINDKDVFNRLIELKSEMSFKGDLSLILTDDEALKIEDEKYLSYYDEDTRKNSFTID